jgi:glycosyltransferase involved in cell wall biosynthesis
MHSERTRSTILIIAGMHRSGTSLTAALLQDAGVDIGQRLMGSGSHNVKGHFENLDFVEFHEDILYSQGFNRAGWTLSPSIQVQEQYLERAKLIVEKNSGKKIWGWKDPRATLFLDFWANLIPEAKFLLIYRTPWEVVDSLYRRSDDVFYSNPNLAIELWVHYNQIILEFYKQFPDRCLLLNINQIIKDSSFLVEAIKDKFGISLLIPAPDIYESSLFCTQVSTSHRRALVNHYFHKTVALYWEMNALAAPDFQGNGTAQSSNLELPKSSDYQAWVLQDWLDVRRLEKKQSELCSQLQQTESQLGQAQFQLGQAQFQHQQTQSQLQQIQVQLERSQSQLQHTQEELERSQTLILAMESSKFWKLRSAWFKLKRAIGIPENASFQLNRSLSKLEKLLHLLKEKGWRYTIARVSRKVYLKLEKDPANREYLSEDYQKWLEKNAPREADLRQMAETVDIFPYKPIISIVMPVFNTPEPFLQQAIESVLHQTYPHWELCIADDASTEARVKRILEDYALKDSRIKVCYREENGHISQASNSAIALATGEFLALLDHDDVLAPHALHEVALLLNRHPEADMIYSDEDKIDENNQFRDPFFKPDWCPDSFLSRMYTCHLGIYRRSLVNEIGGFRVGYEGSQDYDLTLRLTEKTDKIFHIPKVLYHWRIHSESTARSLVSKSYAADAAKRAIAEALDRRGELGRVIPVPGGHHIVRYEIKNFQRVSIIIPTKNLGNILNQCLTSIFEKTTYPNYEVIVIDNGSTEAKALEVIEFWRTKEPNRFRCERFDIPFNYSKVNNYGVNKANGEYLLFLNNDTEVLTPDWVDAMVEQAQRPCIGAVGALLLYPDNTVQHAGVVSVGAVAGHSHKHYPADSPGYFNQIQTVNNYSAVTAACLMCRRDVFEEVGGFEEELAVALNDVDLCFKIVEKGYRNIYLPHVKLYHYESKSRGYEDTREKQERFIKEMKYMQRKWKKIIERDPCYSPNLIKSREDYAINI